MPYDRKTELLWNYIGIAQFSDLAKIWGGGPAQISGIYLDGQANTASASPHDVEEAPDVMTGHSAPVDISLPLGALAGSGHPNDFPHIAADEPQPHGAVSHAPLIISQIHAAGSSPGLAITVPLRGGYDHAPAIRMSSPESPQSDGDDDGNRPALYSPSHNDDPATMETETDTPLPEVPKIYGPSAVHMEASVTGGGNTQNSVIITEGENALRGWSDLGSDTIGNVIDQVRAPDADNPYHLTIDYVAGDLTSLSTLTQLNTIYDGDLNKSIASISAATQSLITDASVSQFIASGNNYSVNTATLAGNQALEGYDVLVVTGDLTKINKIMQVNLIVDDDTNTTVGNASIDMPYGSATSVWEAAIKSGGNMQVNVGFIVDQQSGAIYLVGGFYGSSHSATQVNILSDSDLNDILQLFHAQEGNGFLDFFTGGQINSGGNNQSNTAGFIGGDGDDQDHHGLPPLSDLTSLLAFAGLHPEDGDVRVLFVDGNYTIINLVVQINVINDSDHNLLVANADGSMGALTAPPEAPETQGTDTNSGTETDQIAISDGSEDTSNSAPAGDETPATDSDVSESETAHGDESHTAQTSNEGSSDSALPVYPDHGNLNYDQIITSGGNEAGNHAVLIDGNGPKLQIVQGNYTEYNEIYQVNVLLDADHNRIVSAMNSDDHPGGGDNTIQDTAHTVSADDVLHKMMT